MPVTVTAVAIVVVVIIVFIAAYFLIVNNKQHEQQKQFNVIIIIIIIITGTVVAAPLLLLLPALSNLTLFTLLEHFFVQCIFFIFGSLHTLLQFKHLIACLMPSLFVYKLV